ncbi:MAG: DUF3800 domain-containing protein [Candidatus Abawacabacteria bacterium]|nr:DUF3800 domain-containing protein [Candidatus Abawacabacteria bacterium]
MYLMYIDESGNTAHNMAEGASKFLVLTGCIIHEDDRLNIETEFRRLKKKYYQNEDIEVKSNFLRYANPDRKEGSPLKLFNREAYDRLEADVAAFLKSVPIHLISVVIEKETYWEQYPNQKPYNAAYIFLLERFQLFLQQEKALGMCIIDPREGQVQKSFIGDDLDGIHHSIRWSGGPYTIQCPRIVERLLYATSDKTIGIQIADLFCYPIFHVFQYDKLPTEYWRFQELSLPKLLKGPKGIVGHGLKVFPTKKDLKTLSEIHF